MPRIPNYTAERGITGESAAVFMPEGINDAVGRGLSQLGNTFGGLAEIQQKREQEILNNKLVDISTRYNNTLTKFELSEQERKQDQAMGSMGRVNTIRDNFIASIDKEFGDNETFRQAGLAKINSMTEAVRYRRATHESAETMAWKAQLEKNTLESVQNTVFNMPETYPDGIKQIEQYYSNAMHIPDAVKQEKIKDALSGLAVMAFRGRVNTDDPDRIQQAIADLKSGMYNELDPKAKTQLEKEADGLLKSVQSDMNDKIKEAKIQAKTDQNAAWQAKSEELQVLRENGKLTRTAILKSGLPGVPGKDIDTQYTRSWWLDKLESDNKKLERASKGEGASGYKELLSNMLADPKAFDSKEIYYAEVAGTIKTKEANALRQRYNTLSKQVDPMRQQRLTRIASKIGSLPMPEEIRTEALNYLSDKVATDMNQDPDKFFQELTKQVPYASFIKGINVEVPFTRKSLRDYRGSLDKIISGETPISRQGQATPPATDSRRQKAIDQLRADGKPVTDRNIEYVMRFIK